jgi:hypothetical protein
MKEPPIEVDIVENFDKGKKAKVRLGTIVGQGLHQILQFGNQGGVGISGSAYAGIIELVSKGDRSIYKFAVIGRRGDGLTYTIPLFIGPDAFDAIEEIVRNAM